MKITEEVNAGVNVISAYTPNGIIVNGSEYGGGLLIAPDRLEPGWLSGSVDDLTREALDDIVNARPEVVIFGTGARTIFPSRSVRRFFQEHEIGIETMDSPAACRTYNLLAQDGRRVLAVLVLEA